MKSMKIIKKFLTGLLMAAMLLGCMPVQNAEAAPAKSVKKSIKKIVVVDSQVDDDEVDPDRTASIGSIVLGKKDAGFTLKVLVYPKDSAKKITYKSSNKKVATVDSNGKITPKKLGKAKITITALGKDGKKKTVKVQVKVVKKGTKKVTI